ncbi:Acetyltransferase (GNAT) domain-containing protein [Paenibacillus algorifonticola]|uniref:Acetyltransferase (GNAT) domain-containing protein n=1 Tax=Paenibacillus algorifonticola TaxID=684063 RepID=A0A1I2IEQ9_9BACL|nr:GNAT family N-acetyltransferase [Paenibacillus algorifonticola]SFF40805.1 Acetyltransferase (GNAT) domain-containing protein [Paenibacillus algorifonticola]
MHLSKPIVKELNLTEITEQHVTKKEKRNKAAEYLLPLMQNGVNLFIRNVSTELRLLQAGQTWLPMTVNEQEYDNSYVCSPYGTYIKYAEEELYLLENPLLRFLCGSLLKAIAPLLRLAKIDRNVHVNNWLLSTNLYTEISADELEGVTQTLTESYPEHAIIYRSLNRRTNGALMEQLLRQGYVLVPSRQVYFFNGAVPLYLKKKNTKWDRKLLAQSTYRIVPHAELGEPDYERIAELYDLLYVGKYSALNPKFTAEYIRHCHQKGLLEMTGLCDEQGVLQGVMGCFIHGEVISVPLVGYNTALAQHNGLYRMLMHLAMQAAADRGQLLHLSSGAAEFKRVRGAEAEMEYSAVYIMHLSAGRRAVWRGLSKLLLTAGVPLMRKYKL